MACAHGSGIAPGLSGRSACATASRWLVEVEQRTRQPVDLIDHDNVNRALCNIAEKPLQGRAV